MSNDDVSKVNIDKDYEYSRDTYYDLIEKGRESLELMIEVARESEHPRAFEVLNGMIKGVSDVNDKLMDLNRKHKDITKVVVTDPALPPPSATPNAITHNNVFIGSTTDLQRMLADVARDEKIIQQQEKELDETIIEDIKEDDIIEKDT